MAKAGIRETDQAQGQFGALCLKATPLPTPGQHYISIQLIHSQESIYCWEHVQQNQLPLLEMSVNVLEAGVRIRALSSKQERKTKLQLMDHSKRARAEGWGQC